MSTRPILFVGGGSGGHIAPLLAVVEALLKLDPERPLHYVGTAADLQSPLLESLPAQVQRHAIVAGKLNRFLTVRQVGESARAVQGLWQADRLIARLRPAAVVAKGAYVSVPVVVAAARRGIPVFTHETDLIPGLANRIVARYARTIFTAFPADAYTQLPADHLLATGQPVRPVFYTTSTEDAAGLSVAGRVLSADLPIVTVVGGSQGARDINELIIGAWSKLLPQTQLVMLTGPSELSAVEAAAERLPAELRERLFLTAFLTDSLPLVLKRSTVVVSRAGGMFWELIAVRVPSILIPLPAAAQDHQRANARFLQQAGAVEVLDQEGLTGDGLAERVLGLLQDSERRGALSGAMQRLDHPDAASRMAEHILSHLK